MTSAVQQFPQLAYFIICDTSPTELGTYLLAESGDLMSAEVRFYHKMVGAYSYSLRLVVSSSEGGPELCASTAFTFDNATTGQATDDWLGAVVFDMPNFALVASQNYFFRLETTGYTRDADAEYLAILCDWMEPIGVDSTGGARIALGVRQ